MTLNLTLWPSNQNLTQILQWPTYLLKMRPIGQMVQKLSFRQTQSDASESITFLLLRAVTIRGEKWFSFPTGGGGVNNLSFVLYLSRSPQRQQHREGRDFKSTYKNRKKNPRDQIQHDKDTVGTVRVITQVSHPSVYFYADSLLKVERYQVFNKIPSLRGNSPESTTLDQA